MTQDRASRIRQRLASLEAEKSRLTRELAEIGTEPSVSQPVRPLGSPARTVIPSSADEKISLFLALFRCREDVYPRLWESPAKNKKGYAPVCLNEWKRGVCDKPKVKCADCPHRVFKPLDEEAVQAHLEGKETIGTYAIRRDDTCSFLAADFDGDHWQEDVAAYQRAADEFGVDVAVERSRSGAGAHAWIFFSEPVPAKTARQLGTLILARASSSRATMNLQSYDRFFPNQDILPRGGFGNLIALPLQKKPRESGHSVFVDDAFDPHPDQWAFLISIRRLSSGDLAGLLGRLHQNTVFTGEDADLKAAEQVLDYGIRKAGPVSYAGQLTFILSSHLEVRLDPDIPSRLVAAFKRTATFANPKFFELQRLRFSTWKTPRFIFCGEILPDRLILPRGSLECCLDLCRISGSQAVVHDQRPALAKLEVTFSGTLAPEQRKAVAEMAKTEFGVLVAPPGAGKTVIGCALIAKRKLPALILVHRAPLVEQWKARLAEFLGLEGKAVGAIGGQRRKITGKVDVAMLQTLAKTEQGPEFFRQYGQVIVDECHHIPAFSFESVLKRFTARYVLGLTATPYRKDGHQAIIHMQCGPTRYEMTAVEGAAFKKKVIVKASDFKMPEEAGAQPPLHLLWEALVADPVRLGLVSRDVCAVLKAGGFPLVISDRKDHLALLSEQIKRDLGDFPVREFVFAGQAGKKARKKALEEIQSLLDGEVRPYILATGSLIGEGFDLPALDTLVMAMPISFKGRVVQYAGRLHRPYPTKTEVVIHDYVDIKSSLFLSMYRKRQRAYKTLGYILDAPIGLGYRGKDRGARLL